MGRPKGSRASGPRMELELIGLDELATEIAQWEVQLVAERLRAITEAPTRDEIDGACDAAG